MTTMRARTTHPNLIWRFSFVSYARYAVNVEQASRAIRNANFLKTRNMYGCALLSLLEDFKYLYSARVSLIYNLVHLFQININTL